MPKWAGLLATSVFSDKLRYTTITAGLLKEFRYSFHAPIWPRFLEQTHLKFSDERALSYRPTLDTISKRYESEETIAGFDMSKIFNDYPSFETEVRQVVMPGKQNLETFLTNAKRSYDGLELEVRQVAPKP